MVKIPQKEIIEAMTELSNGAYKLLLYYYSRRDGWTFNDKHIAKYTGTSERQIKKFRKELIDKKYLSIQFGGVVIYFIGKEVNKKFEIEKSLF